MQITATPLKPLSGITLSAEETKILKWIRSVQWEPQKDAHAPIPYKARVPEFYAGVRLYQMQGVTHGNSLGLLELFIKKLQHQGVIGKQEMYPLSGHGAARHLSLKKADLDNLGVGKNEEDEE